jgi:enoyl-CoA hydratase/carnithine racemase
MSTDIHSTPFARFARAMMAYPKPIVAAVRGPAIGIGLTLLLHCDVVIASERATFGAPFAKLALVPEFCSSYALPKAVGRSMAAEVGGYILQMLNWLILRPQCRYCCLGAR